MENEKLINLVQKAQQGDTNAMDALFTDYYNDVYYFALKTVKDSDVACDVTQETFLEIIRTIGNLKEPLAFVTWMKQITYHQCTRYFNKRQDVQVEEDEDGNTIFDTLADDGAMPAEILEQEEFRQTILSMIENLTEEQRSAVLLYYFDELTVGQIAQIQGVSEGTVKSRLNYARKAIKKSVESYEEKHNIKLHSFALLPLLMLFFGKAAMPQAKAAAVRSAVLGTAAKTAAVAATQTTAATTAAITKTTAAKAAGGMIMKFTMPLWAKIVAAILAVAIVAGAGVAIGSGSNKDKKPENPSISETTQATTPEATQGQSVTPKPVDPNHTHEWKTEEKAPSQYAMGSVVHTCAICGESETEYTTDAAGPFEPGTLVYGKTSLKLYGENNEVACVWESLDDGTFAERKEEFVHVIIPDGCSPKAATITLRDCSNLVSAYIGKTSNIPIFRGCGKLKDVTIKTNRVTTIWESTFSQCKSLTSITIPDGVKTIGKNAFSDCIALTEVVIPDGVITIYADAFAGCRKLDSVNIPNSVRTIDARAFEKCNSLTSVIIPDGVKSIGSSAFAYCGKLTDVTIPDSVTTLGSKAFAYCTSLTDVKISKNITIIPTSLFYGTSLTEVTIPEGVTTIEDHAFKECRKLTKIVIPGSVTSIGTTKEVERNVLAGFGVFEHDNKLSDIQFNGTVEQWQKVTKEDFWWCGGGVATSYVQCTDGQVEI